MIDRDRSRPASSRRPRRARSVAAALAGVLACGAGAAVIAGCDSSSDGGQPFPEFEGRWFVDIDTSNVTCPKMQIDPNPQSISPWSNPPPPIATGADLGIVTLEAGVLTDLIETSSECHFGYHVKDTVATVVGADLQTAHPDCVMLLPRGDGSNLVLSPSTTQPLTFQLAAPVKGMAQMAFITGAAGATVNFDDGAGGVSKLAGCTFGAQVQLHKIAKP